MAYRFKLNEPVDKGFKRIATEQIELAISTLRSGEDRVTAVHEARKSIKRMRALLKLLRPSIKDDGYQRENRRFRDIARQLAGTRDADVLKATAARFSASGSAKVRKAAAALAVTPEPAVSPDSGGDDHIAKAIAGLAAAQAEIGDVEITDSGFAAFRRGLEKTYQAGRRAMTSAYDDHHDEAFHEWRKWVQVHWRHMLLLERCWPEVMLARAALAKETGELLGEDHDLYMLIKTALAATDGGEASPGARALAAAARQRQQKIRRELAAKGEALYAEGAAEFAERIGHYWAAAKAARRLAQEEERQQADPTADPPEPGKRAGGKPAAESSAKSSRKSPPDPR